jgi:hypothetical protein
MNSFKMQWNHLVYMDNFCYSAFHMDIETCRQHMDKQKWWHFKKKDSNTYKTFARLKQIHTPFANGNELAKVLIEWLGSKLE